MPSLGGLASGPGRPLPHAPALTICPFLIDAQVYRPSFARISISSYIRKHSGCTNKDYLLDSQIFATQVLNMLKDLLFVCIFASIRDASRRISSYIRKYSQRRCSIFARISSYIRKHSRCIKKDFLAYSQIFATRVLNIRTDWF